MSKIVFTFGRFNPPTIGHMLLVDKIRGVAKKKRATALVFTGSTQDKKKNPLNFKDKIKYMKKAFKGVTVVNETSVKTIFDALEYFDKRGYKDITLVVGSDRVSEFKNLIKKYLKDYNFTVLKLCQRVKGTQKRKVQRECLHQK